MNNSTHDCLYYLYNELAPKEARSFRIRLLEDGELQTLYMLLRKRKRAIKRSLKLVAPPQKCIDYILAYAQKP